MSKRKYGEKIKIEVLDIKKFKKKLILFSLCQPPGYLWVYTKNFGPCGRLAGFREHIHYYIYYIDHTYSHFVLLIYLQVFCTF